MYCLETYSYEGLVERIQTNNFPLMTRKEEGKHGLTKQHSFVMDTLSPKYIK